MPVTHAFVSAKGDDADTTLVRPSNWNAAHLIDTLLLAGDITDTSVGTQNDWAPTGLATATIIRWNGASALTLSGITGGADGRILILQNVTAAQTITLRHDLTSTAANRFFLPGGIDNFVIGPNSAEFLIYDSTSSRWRVDAEAASSGASYAGTWRYPGI